VWAGGAAARHQQHASTSRWVGGTARQFLLKFRVFMMFSLMGFYMLGLLEH
jgi:hypothetical protein